MAVPTLSANTPATGQIQWTAFSIQYGGVTYSVPTYQTDKRYTWWAYNAGAPTLNFSDTTPVLGDDDLLLFLNKNGLPINVQFANVLDGDLIVDGTILAKHIGANQITAESFDVKVLAAGMTVTGKIKVGTHTWTPSEGLIIPGVAVFPGGPTSQSFYVSGSPTGGTFTLTGNQATTAPIAYNASAATVQTAIRTLGGTWTNATVTGAGTLASPWVAVATGGTEPLSAATSFTGGTTPLVVITQGDINAQLTANLVAKSLTVQQNLELYGTTNFIRGTVNLASGVTRPTTSPTVYQSWPILGSHAMGFGATDYGLTNHLTATDILVTAQAFFGGGIVGIRKDNGQYQAIAGTNISGWAGNFNPTGGIVSSNVSGQNYYYVLGYHTNGHDYIYKLDSSFSFVASYDVTFLLPPGHGRYALGRDESGNIMIAVSYPPNTLRVLFWYGPSIGAGGANGYIGYRDYTTFTSIGASNISYCGEGNYDFGALRDVIAVENVANFVCDSSGNRLSDAYVFSPANGATVRGMWWDGQRFWSYSSDGTLAKHGRNIQPQTITVSHTWADRNTTGAVHETEETTNPATFVQSARTWVNVTTPPPPDAGSTNTDAANRIGIYAAAGAGARVRQTQVGPAGTDAGYLLDPGSSGQGQASWETLVTGTSAPPGSNGFVGIAGTGVGILRSQGATTGQGILLNGDGSFQLGRLSGAANGALSGAGVDSWMNLTTNVGSNQTVNSTSYVVINGLTRTFTVPVGGGTYRVSFSAWCGMGVGQTLLILPHVDGVAATMPAGVLIANNSGGSVACEGLITLAAGTHTIDIRAAVGGAGQSGFIAGYPNAGMIIERKA